MLSESRLGHTMPTTIPGKPMFNGGVQ